MLGLSDVVVIGLPLTKATRHLFTRDLFRRMQRHAVIINVTRGEIIYGEDLLAALDEGLIWGAGLDVTDPEPLPKDHRLWTHPRVVVTPHTAGGSPRRAQRVIDTFCENLRRMRAGQPLLALIDKDKGYSTRRGPRRPPPNLPQNGLRRRSRRSRRSTFRPLDGCAERLLEEASTALRSKGGARGQECRHP